MWRKRSRKEERQHIELCTPYNSLNKQLHSLTVHWIYFKCINICEREQASERARARPQTLSWSPSPSPPNMYVMCIGGIRSYSASKHFFHSVHTFFHTPQSDTVRVQCTCAHTRESLRQQILYANERLLCECDRSVLELKQTKNRILSYFFSRFVSFAHSVWFASSSALLFSLISRVRKPCFHMHTHAGVGCVCVKN